MSTDDARIRADERERIAAAIEADHRPGTYPHSMAAMIRANAKQDGSEINADWHTRAIEAARADERRLERSRAERDIAAFVQGEGDDFDSDGGTWAFARDIAECIRESDYPKADPEPAPAPVEPNPYAEMARAERYENGVAAPPAMETCGRPECTPFVYCPHGAATEPPAPVEWVDGKATVGGVRLHAAQSAFDARVTVVEVFEKDDRYIAWIAQRDEATAKRLAVAVAVALAETGRTP